MPFAHLPGPHDVETNKKCTSLWAKQPECVVSVISDTSADRIHSSRKHIRTKLTPKFHLTYSKNGGNLGLVSNNKKW